MQPEKDHTSCRPLSARALPFIGGRNIGQQRLWSRRSVRPVLRKIAHRGIVTADRDVSLAAQPAQPTAIAENPVRQGFLLPDPGRGAIPVTQVEKMVLCDHCGRMRYPNRNCQRFSDRYAHRIVAGYKTA